MKEFVCEDCKGKSYSAADLDKQIKPECPYCSSKKLKDTSNQSDPAIMPKFI
jgi:DNA-directed RNA polymerase subunit RPC12/RpoP